MNAAHPDGSSERVEAASGGVIALLQGWSDRRLVLAIASISTVILAADVLTPTGVAGAVPYLLPVALCLGSRDRRLVMATAMATSLLTVVGMVLAPSGGGPVGYVLANRGLALFAIWITATGVRSQLALLDRLDQAHTDLRHKESLARLGEMAAVVAHEVKNPLAGIMGVLQVLLARRRPAAERKVLTDVHERLSGLATTVDDLMAFARPSQLRTQDLDLLELLRETRKLVEADGHFPELQLVVEGDTVTATADHNQLRRALLNVVLNAAAASEGRGTIRTWTERVNGSALIHVHDDGPGIPDHVRARIFEPFFTTRTQGTGLGLPLVHQAIEAHGGHIDILCPPTGGTTVTLALPATSQA